MQSNKDGPQVSNQDRLIIWKAVAQTDNHKCWPVKDPQAVIAAAKRSCVVITKAIHRHKDKPRLLQFGDSIWILFFSNLNFLSNFLFYVFWLKSIRVYFLHFAVFLGYYVFFLKSV